MRRLIGVLLLGLLSTACSSESKTVQQVQVYINDGAKQCIGGGLTIKQTAEKLSKDGVEVITSSCGTINGMMVIAQCGAPELSVNIHTISHSDLNKAVKLGFKPLADLKDGVTTTDCPVQKPVKGSEASF
ncbi:hypothetical protein [Parashewanella tropica]|uniref:hypothetical protein n=1 Tax=Parashewanella tropica TaxID=2547970 RepID=UPI00105A01A5|nr:hypothetical protein [Parashewanella tropica]